MVIFFARHEAMTDLIGIMGSLVDTKGKILIAGVNDTVAPLTDEEQKLYEPIDFDPVSTSRSAAHYSTITCFKPMGLSDFYQLPLILTVLLHVA